MGTFRGAGGSASHGLVEPAWLGRRAEVALELGVAHMKIATLIHGATELDQRFAPGVSVEIFDKSLPLHQAEDAGAVGVESLEEGAERVLVHCGLGWRGRRRQEPMPDRRMGSIERVAAHRLSAGIESMHDGSRVRMLDGDSGQAHSVGYVLHRPGGCGCRCRRHTGLDAALTAPTRKG